MALRHVLCISLLFMSTLTTLCQMRQKSNPIIFSEMFVGHCWGGTGGFSGGAAVNVQGGQSMFTLRQVGTVKLHSEIASPFIPIPLFEQKSSLSESSLLYGRRFISNSSAYSFSVGVSYNEFSRQVPDNNNQKVVKTSYYAGLPFETNIKWFNARKERFRIYGLIPIGKLTGFGGSFGFKMFGNISRYSYVGLGIVLGLGIHKKYE